MIYRHTSIQILLAKLYRDLKPSSSSWEADALEWAGEALDFIGHHSGFIPKTAELEVQDHRVALPCDFYSLCGHAIEYDGDDIPEGQNSHKLYDDDADEKYYFIKNGYIRTGFESGTIGFRYNAFPTDEAGYPLIPDNVYYRQAIEWYIMRQMKMGGYTFSNPEFTFDYLDKKWKHYCTAAANDASFPSIDKMEAFRNAWCRIVPLGHLVYDQETIDGRTNE